MKLTQIFIELFFYILNIHLFIQIYFFFHFILTLLYWFCHISKWIHHRYTCVPHPEPSSLPIPSLWVIPVHQPQASSILHRTWTGNSFHIWCYTCFKIYVLSIFSMSGTLLNASITTVKRGNLPLPNGTYCPVEVKYISCFNFERNLKLLFYN